MNIAAKAIEATPLNKMTKKSFKIGLRLQNDWHFTLISSLLFIGVTRFDFLGMTIVIALPLRDLVLDIDCSLILDMVELLLELKTSS